LKSIRCVQVMWKDTAMLIRHVQQWKIIFCCVIGFPAACVYCFSWRIVVEVIFFSLSSLEIPVWQLKSLVSTLSWRYFNINTHSVDFFFLVLLYVFVLFFIFILQSTFSVFCFLYSVLVPSFFLYFYLISFINFQLFLISFFNQNI
jgi:hypothetical protein